MFPVDGRIGNGYTRGARQFIDTFQVGLLVPMHFVASGFESAWRMKEFTDAKTFLSGASVAKEIVLNFEGKIVYILR